MELTTDPRVGIASCPVAKQTAESVIMLDTPSGLEMVHGCMLEPTAGLSVVDTEDVSVGLTVVQTLGPVTEPRAVVVELE